MDRENEGEKRKNSTEEGEVKKSVNEQERMTSVGEK